MKRAKDHSKRTHRSRRLKKIIIGSTFGITIFALTVFPSLNNSCTPTNFYKDGINLTAALVNPPTIPEELDASKCNIGVYYESGNYSLENTKIYGANYYGVVVDGNINNVSVNISNSIIHDIGEKPFNSAQHGVGIYYSAMGQGTATGNISDSYIYAYQKGGIVLEGKGVNVNATKNKVHGIGQVNFIAQNGIEVAYGANGSIVDNSIYANYNTGSEGGEANPAGKTPPSGLYVSSALLLNHPGNLSQHQNFFNRNQRNITNVQ